MTTSKEQAFLQEDYTKTEIKAKTDWVAQLVHLCPVPANLCIVLKVREVHSEYLFASQL